MNGLHSRLGAALDTDAARYSGADFANARMGSVAGSIRRRRAVRAAGVGGASVVGVSAIAAGSAAVPWGSLVYGAAPGSASVVCTTTTPDAAAGSADEVPTGAAMEVWVVQDERTGEVSSWVLDDGNGEPPVTITLDGVRVMVSLGGAEPVELVPGADSRYQIELGDGTELFVTIDDDDLNVVRAPREDAAGEQDPEPGDSLIVTCVTESPEPSASASPSATPRALATSPFQCGYEFATEVGGTGGLAIGEPTWLSAADAEAEIRVYIGDPDSVNLRLSGAPVPVISVEWPAVWFTESYGANIGPEDPGTTSAGYSTDGDGNVSGDFNAGAQYVLAADGAVVATFDRDAEPTTQYIDLDGWGLTLHGLDLTTGLLACEGVDEAALADAQVVAVTGINHLGDDGIEGPYYAWRFVGQP